MPVVRMQPNPLQVRPASSQEPTGYLDDPTFSNCTVPLVVYPSATHNFAHLFAGKRVWVAGCWQAWQLLLWPR